MSGWTIDKYKVTLRLLQPMLGTVPTQKSIWAEHIATQQRKKMKKDGNLTDDQIEKELEDTIEGVKDNDELTNGFTSFFKDEEGYFLKAYQVKGFLKESSNNLKEFGNVKQLKNKVTRFLFVKPEKVYIAKPDTTLEVIERPLRADTPMGPRVAIARSHCVPEGTELNLELHSLQEVLNEKCIRTILEYGEYQGLNQWRSSGAGRFEVVKFEGV